MKSVYDRKSATLSSSLNRFHSGIGEHHRKCFKKGLHVCCTASKEVNGIATGQRLSGYKEGAQARDNRNFVHYHGANKTTEV
jgi:hypothetical protein